MWMFPRNIRSIEPWKIYQILTVLMKFDDLIRTNKDDQKYLYYMLSEAGIKSAGNTRDNNPGGMRTYFAQLETLGLVYEKDKRFFYTIAGQNIADENNPRRVLQVQLLRHQYPSAYGNGRNVLIDPRIKIKPFVFLCKLLQDERLGEYLTSNEMMIPIIYGHNDDCYEFCVQKILEFRTVNNLESVLENITLDLYTPRSGFGHNIGNVKDIANTAKNYMEACGLIVPLNKKINGQQIYAFNKECYDLYESIKDEPFLSCKTKDDVESFQRAYGRYDKTKDTRKDTESRGAVESPESAFVKFKYILYANEHLFVADEQEFYDSMKNMGISYNIVSESLGSYKAKRRTIDENNFLEYANSGGTKSNEFEQAITNIFCRMGFSDSEWIGRKKASNDRRGNYPDVFVKQPNNHDAGFIEAKATSSYSLGHTDMVKMKTTYVKTNKELDPLSNLKFYLYIAGGFRGNINSSVIELQEETSIPVTALTARSVLELLKLHEEGLISTNNIQKKILSHGGLIDVCEIIAMGDNNE